MKEQTRNVAERRDAQRERETESAGHEWLGTGQRMTTGYCRREGAPPRDAGRRRGPRRRTATTQPELPPPDYPQQSLQREDLLPLFALILPSFLPPIASPWYILSLFSPHVPL